MDSFPLDITQYWKYLYILYPTSNPPLKLLLELSFQESIVVFYLTYESFENQI